MKNPFHPEPRPLPVIPAKAGTQAPARHSGEGRNPALDRHSGEGRNDGQENEASEQLKVLKFRMNQKPPPDADHDLVVAMRSRPRDGGGFFLQGSAKDTLRGMGDSGKTAVTHVLHALAYHAQIEFIILFLS